MRRKRPTQPVENNPVASTISGVNWTTCPRLHPRNPPARRVFAALLVLTLTACGINPQEVNDVPSSRDFYALTCEQLAGEKGRIEAGYKEVRWSSKAGTRKKIARLNGEAKAVTDALHRHDCKTAAVRIPGYPIQEDRINP